MNCQHSLQFRCVIVVWGAMAFACGCGGRPLLGPIGARSNSYVYEDEDVQLRMLNKDELKLAPPEVSQDAWEKHLATELPGIYGSDDKSHALMAAPLVALAVGFAVDQVKSELEKEAETYEAQFDATLYERGFWDNPGAASPEPHFYGFELTRWARGYSGKNAPAYHLICAIAPARALKAAGNPNTDRRVFAIKPLMFCTKAAKAKVLWSGRRLNSKIDLALDATWIDAGQTVHQERVATANFEFKGYDLERSPVLTTEIHDIAGWFGGIPLSINGQSKTAENGAFKITAVVTESDQSQAKQVFERVAKFVGDKKQTIVNAATQPFQP